MQSPVAVIIHLHFYMSDIGGRVLGVGTEHTLTHTRATAIQSAILHNAFVDTAGFSSVIVWIRVVGICA